MIYLQTDGIFKEFLLDISSDTRRFIMDGINGRKMLSEYGSLEMRKEFTRNKEFIKTIENLKK